MSDYYHNVYLKRLNRYGLDYQSRIQGQRERVFEDLLLKSVYRVDFPYKNEMVPGLLERYKQDETETLQYLLLRVNMDIPAGTILRIPNKNYHYGEIMTDDNSYYWMILFLENMKRSGYNRYVVLKMTHEITWNDRNGNSHTALGYFKGKGKNPVIDSIVGGTAGPLYEEPQYLFMFITPYTPDLKKEDYFSITNSSGIVAGYRVTGYDEISTPGVEYVSIDPVYVRDESATPEKTNTDTNEDFYWLDGGSN